MNGGNLLKETEKLFRLTAEFGNIHSGEIIKSAEIHTTGRSQSTHNARQGGEAV